MNNNGNRFLKLCALLLLALGVFSLLYLLKLRFDAGDSLPVGSSLRSDPLGVEVLFESLNSSGVAQAERNYFEIELAELDNYDMLVFSHASPFLHDLHEETIHNFVTNHGGRLLITLGPQTHVRKRRDERRKQEDAEDEESTEKEDDTDKNDSEESDEAGDKKSCTGCSCSCCNEDSTNRLWYGICQVEMEHKPIQAELNPDYECVDFDLPPTLSVKTVASLSTNLLHSGWQAIYSCSGMPVVVERWCGKGSVVISSLSYPFSNEAMRAERETGFLLWSFDGSKRILFDESHFGLVISRTVAKLIRKNNLHYALLALLIPVILYFRLAAVPLVPRYTEDIAPDDKYDEDSASALCKLLMRSVPPDGVVPVALDAWREANGERVRAMSADQRELFEELVAKNRKRSGKFPREKDIVAAYNEVVELLNDEC